jgi:hypothetical protein
LFRTLFDSLRQSGTDLVVTSLQTPGDLKGLHNNIVNRLRGGLCVGVKRPGPTSRERLLAHFCSHLQMAIPPRHTTRASVSASGDPSDTGHDRVRCESRCARVRRTTCGHAFDVARSRCRCSTSVRDVPRPRTD